jgi:release factor glutamine methyltransferase
MGTDVVPEACALAASNAESLGLDERAQFAVGSWWDSVPAGTAAFDVIMSNPPYIAIAEHPTLMADVRDYEPATALFAADDGLAEYRAIVARAASYLKTEGVLLFEVGATQAHAVQAIAERAGLRYLSTHHDLAGMARVVAFRAAAV